MVEKIIFSILSIAIFMLTFFKLIKKNDTSYIYILLVEFIGIAIYFMELFFTFTLPIVLKIIVYLFSIILPGILLWIEKVKKIDFPELFHVAIAKILEKMGKEEQAKIMITHFLDKNPNSYLAHKLLAHFYEKAQNYEAAISEYMKVVDLKPKDFMAQYKLATVLSKNKQQEEAIVVLQDILKQKPEK